MEDLVIAGGVHRIKNFHNASARDEEAKPSHWGLASMCVGGGMGMAMVFEREKSL